MEKEFIPYEQALALKELGFDEPCLSYFDSRLEHQIGNFDFREVSGYKESTSALSPLYQQAFRWFREKYGYDVTIKKCTPSEYKFEIEQLFVEGNNYYFIDFSFDTYEEAEVACLRKLIEIVKRK
jgi:hypothetical protein